MACPHVAGGAALMLERNPDFKSEQVLEKLLNKAAANYITDLKKDDTNKLLYVAADAPPPPGSVPAPGSCPWHGCLLGCGGENCKYCERCQEASLVQAESTSSMAAQMYRGTVHGDMLAFKNGCQVPNLVFSGIRTAINNVWKGLEARDPAVLRIAGNRSFNVIGCGIELDADANISFGGFSEGGIRQLACTQSRCVQKARDGSCANTEYDFSAHLSVGDCKDTLSVAGGVDADWGLCGRDIPRHAIDASFDLVGPGLKVDLSVEHQGGVQAKISEVRTLNVNWGVPSNYKCGFEGLPGFVGGLLSDWCVSLMDWVAQRIQEHMQGDVDKWVMEVLNRKLDL